MQASVGLFIWPRKQRHTTFELTGRSDPHVFPCVRIQSTLLRCLPGHTIQLNTSSATSRATGSDFSVVLDYSMPCLSHKGLRSVHSRLILDKVNARPPSRLPLRSSSEQLSFNRGGSCKTLLVQQLGRFYRVGSDSKPLYRQKPFDKTLQQLKQQGLLLRCPSDDPVVKYSAFPPVHTLPSGFHVALHAK